MNAVADQAVGDHDRGIKNRKIKSVPSRSLQMFNRVAAGTDIERIGVGNESFTFKFMDQIDYRPHQNRPDKRGVALFAEVQLNRRQRLRSNPFGYTRRL